MIITVEVEWSLRHLPVEDDNQHDRMTGDQLPTVPILYIMLVPKLSSCYICAFE